MPATPDPNVLELTGATPLRSNVSAHPDALSFVTFADLFCDGANRIHKRRGRGTAIGANAGAPIMSMWEYEYVNPTTGASTFFVFRQFGTKIQRWTGVAWSDEVMIAPATGISGVIALTSGKQGSWLNIKNRVFFVNGADNALLFDGTAWREVGIAAPAIAPTYSIGGTTTLGKISITNGSPTITQVGVALVSLTSVGTTATGTTTGAHHLAVGESVVIAGAATVGYNGTWTVTGTPTSTTFTYTLGGALGAAGGAPTAYMAWPTGAVWVSPYIDINGSRYRVSSVDAANGITLTETVREATAGGLTYVIYHGLMDWANPPSVSFGYLNPTTGHVSNESPPVQVTEKDQVGVTLTYTIAGSAANTAAYNSGYTQIALFRSPKNAYRRIEVNVVINNRNDGLPIVYTETSTSYLDTAFTEFAAPINTNTKPAAGIASLTEYQGRIFGHRPGDDPPSISFSAIKEELPFGRGEESWPARFTRPVTRPTGVLTVGSEGTASSLIVQTGNGDYTIDGLDNLSYTNASLLRTRRSGGFLGGAVEAHGGLVQFYRDKRLIDFASRSDVGEAVQDKLNTLNAAVISGSRVTWFAYESIDYLLLSVPKGAAQATNNYTLVYDYDKEALYEWNFGFSAATTVHNTTSGALDLWVGDSSGDVYTLLQSTAFVDGGSTQYQPSFKTCHIRREELSQRLAHVKLFIGPAASNPAALTWTVNIYVDEETSPSYSYQATAVPAMWQSAQGLELWIAPEKAIRSNVFQVEVVLPSTATDLYIEKCVIVFAPDQEDEAVQ